MVISILKNVFEGNDGGYFNAALLNINGITLNFDKWNRSELFFEGIHKDNSRDIKYWYSKIYCKYKTENHHYYLECLNYIKGYENGTN
jgi:hypothetical protein